MLVLALVAVTGLLFRFVPIPRIVVQGAIPRWVGLHSGAELYRSTEMQPVAAEFVPIGRTREYGDISISTLQSLSHIIGDCSGNDTSWINLAARIGGYRSIQRKFAAGEQNSDYASAVTKLIVERRSLILPQDLENVVDFNFLSRSFPNACYRQRKRKIGDLFKQFITSCRMFICNVEAPRRGQFDFKPSPIGGNQGFLGGISSSYLSKGLSLNLPEHHIELPSVFGQGQRGGPGCFATSLSRLAHFIQLKSSDGGIRNDNDDSDHFDIKRSPLDERFFCGVGFLFIFFGLWNFKLGGNPPLGVLSILVGSCLFFYGCVLLLQSISNSM